MSASSTSLRDQSTRIVFGVDQEPFDSGANRFCLAYPLLVESTGERLDPQQFPSRQRLWWMVNDVASDELEPGCLHVGTFEDAPAFDQRQALGDRYQVRLKGRESNSQEWAQVLRVAGRRPPVDELLYRGVPCERRPWKLVLLEFDDAVVGPFLNVFSAQRRALDLRRYDVNTFAVPCFAPELLRARGEVVELSWVAGQHCRPVPRPQPVALRILRRSVLPQLLADAERLDFTPLDQVCGTMARQLQSAEPGRPLHDEPLSRLRALVPPDDALNRTWLDRLGAALRSGRTQDGLWSSIPQAHRHKLAEFLPPGPPSTGPAAVPRPARPAPTAAIGISSAGTQAAQPPALGEPAFLEQLGAVARAHGLHFSPRDLLAFHLGLKCAPWTVLAGRSGVGKSSLPRIYAEALGAPDSLLHIPVRPDWLDDRDVVGAFDTLSQRFVPAATGLVDFLLDGRLDRGPAGARRSAPLRLLLLDEMNLARIEYYFASFLSLLELPPEQRRLRLFSPQLASADDPYRTHSELPLPTNLRIIGTINVDETTHFLSPKVLDRACVQSLTSPDLRASLIPDLGAPAPRVQAVDWATWQSWIGNRRTLESWVPERLLKIHEALQPLRAGLSHRVFHRCLDYVAGAQALQDLLPTAEALDLALLSCVLPQLRTELPNFAEHAHGLLAELPADDFQRSHELLNLLLQADGGSDFWHVL